MAQFDIRPSIFSPTSQVPNVSLFAPQKQTAPRIQNFSQTTQRSSFTDRAILSNLNKNFVRRILNPEKNIKNKDGSTSTHLMTTATVDMNGKNTPIAYPSIVEVNGKLKRLGDDEAFDFAMKNKEFITFESESDARSFAEGDYKRFFGRKEFLEK
jgi:hypothetical protein